MAAPVRLFPFEILVVDDDEIMRFVLQTQLFKSGFNVTLASSAVHAMHLFQTQKKFDLVLCDLKMPHKSGIDVIKHMLEQKLDIPFILMTGFPVKDKIITAAQLGVQDVLVKPVRQQDLLKAIRSKLDVAAEPPAA